MGLALRHAMTTPPGVAAVPSSTQSRGANLANILKSIGIGWLFLAALGGLTILSLAVANGGRAQVYPELLIIGLLASPGILSLLAGLLIDEVKVGRRKGAQGCRDSWL